MRREKCPLMSVATIALESVACTGTSLTVAPAIGSPSSSRTMPEISRVFCAFTVISNAVTANERSETMRRDDKSDSSFMMCVMIG